MPFKLVWSYILSNKWIPVNFRFIISEINHSLGSSSIWKQHLIADSSRNYFTFTYLIFNNYGIINNLIKGSFNSCNTIINPLYFYSWMTKNFACKRANYLSKCYPFVVCSFQNRSKQYDFQR